MDMVQDLFARGGGMHVVRLSEQSIVDRWVTDGRAFLWDGDRAGSASV